jgi:hypothetical protein
MEQQRGSFFCTWYDLYQIDPIKASDVETKCPAPAKVSRHELESAVLKQGSEWSKRYVSRELQPAASRCCT